MGGGGIIAKNKIKPAKHFVNRLMLAVSPIKATMSNVYKFDLNIGVGQTQLHFRM